MRKYYSIIRPIGPGTIPNSRRVRNVVNFDKKKFCPSIGREAWGYIEYDGVLRDYDSYDLVPEKPKFRRALEPGDCIISRGDSAVIKIILTQDAYNDEYNLDRSYIDCEFRDTSYNYRSWKSNIDGGKVVYYDEGNLAENLSSEVITGIEECVDELKSCGVDTSDSLVYFLVKGRVCHLYSNYKSLGYVSLDAPEDKDEIFRVMLKSVLKEEENVKFIAFPSNLSGNRLLLLSKYPFEYMTYIKAISLAELNEKVKVSSNVSSMDIKRFENLWLRKHGVLEDVISELNEDVDEGEGWTGKRLDNSCVVVCRSKHVLFEVAD